MIDNNTGTIVSRWCLSTEVLVRRLGPHSWTSTWSIQRDTNVCVGISGLPVRAHGHDPAWKFVSSHEVEGNKIELFISHCESWLTALQVGQSVVLTIVSHALYLRRGSALFAIPGDSGRVTGHLNVGCGHFTSAAVTVSHGKESCSTESDELKEDGGVRITKHLLFSCVFILFVYFYLS